MPNMWQKARATPTAWFSNIGGYDEKLAIARHVATFVRPHDVIGAGSGSTAYLTLLEIGRRVREERIPCTIIPTSREMEMIAASVGLITTSLLCDRPTWCYDGADEVDADGALIKGRGGALYREKLVMRASPVRYILIDSSKRVARLGEKFAVPVEVLPEALRYVEGALAEIDGVETSTLRMATGKDGPIITEQGNFLLDVRFSRIARSAEREIKNIVGVLDSGLFIGYAPTIVEGAAA